MWSRERLYSLEAIMLSFVSRNGIHAIDQNRSREAYIPSLQEISLRYNLSPRALQSAASDLQAKGILSERIPHRDGFLLMRPSSFLLELDRAMSAYFLRQRHYVLPPYLQKLSRVDQLKKLSNIVLLEDSATALMHTIYLLPKLEEVYEGTRVLGIDLPLCLGMQMEGRERLEKGLNLVGIKQLDSFSDPLNFPPNHSASDLIIFESKKMTKLIPITPSETLPNIGLMPPALNAIMLRRHPIRGLEQSEALLQKLVNLDFLKIGGKQNDD